ncbi:MAG: M23 family metallopeptidase [Alphaproteobacteria bacterium]|nr:M23 family metallopeptidase [Alphaproteobacteria bacterium]
MRHLFVLVMVLAACSPISSNRWYDSNSGDIADKNFFDRALSNVLRPSKSLVKARKGDNYYRIATRYNVSLRALIEMNNARAPFALNVGDEVRLPKSHIHQVGQGDTLYSLSRYYGVDMSALARANHLDQPYALRVGQKLAIPYGGSKGVVRPPPSPSRATRQVQAPRFRKPVSKPSGKSAGKSTTLPRRTGRFLRPLNGKVISEYGAKGGGLHNDGINIAAAKGAPIKATENGVVVYAGNELRGYGNLLLVRHSDGWVSAYAHTSRFHVRRGDKVKQGQTIANVGQTGNVASPQLHFELRKGTRAVNPKSLI